MLSRSRIIFDKKKSWLEMTFIHDLIWFLSQPSERKNYTLNIFLRKFIQKSLNSLSLSLSLSLSISLSLFLSLSFTE
jgi:hypothetical protein